MNKFLADLFLATAGFILTLANFWFTYGIWPKSWVSFAICYVLFLVLIILRLAQEKEN